MKKIDTKNKILKVARNLFAEKGYAGTSLRELSSRANVNLSGIAYHFKNKENLFWQVFLESHDFLETEVARITKDQTSLKQVMWEIFKTLIEDPNFLRNSFMLMLSDSFPEVDPEIIEKMNDKKDAGPPGGQYIREIVINSITSNVSEEQLMWAVESLFSNVIHWALLMSGKTCSTIYKDHRMFSLENRQKSVELQCEAILNFLEKTKS